MITLQDENGNSTLKGNGIIRFTRIGKLYKLVKITRLVRLLKVVKKKGNITGRMGNVFKISQGQERIITYIAFFFMVCHIMACMWIFSAGMSVDTQLKKD